METQYEHTLTIFRKFDPLKRYAKFAHYEAESFEQDIPFVTHGDIYKINGNFYQIEIKTHISPFKEIKNVLVKHGRHIVKSFYKN